MPPSMRSGWGGSKKVKRVVSLAHRVDTFCEFVNDSLRCVARLLSRRNETETSLVHLSNASRLEICLRGCKASLIGCGLRQWGVLPISLQNQTFTDVLNACISSPSSSGISIRILIVLAVAMLVGFSERALTSFEPRIFGEVSIPRKRR